MENKFEMIKSIMDGQVFDINKKLLRFSIINRDSEFVFSEFYNFESNEDVLVFIENVVIPSALVSIINEDNGELVITIEDSKNFINTLKGYGVDEVLIHKCEVLYSDLKEFRESLDFKNDEFSELLDHINFELTENHLVMLSIEYAMDTSHYLSHMYYEYKEMNHIDILEKELAKLNICIGGFLDICEHTEKYSDEIKEKLLDRLPY